ncbi:hypothetical protein EJ05DRAFT_513096 [Pseudovirgaria hyperparasitica]|uniref:Auxiliary Activity family 9 catalytic domain-containing protein n=1 Tax=Pseudovirgaria hyperparasitica TaxID=470096 RepID=A0A6A6W0I7_9PEZI|nr:uncharacterized protein EJ05DRAFT_513096 [Pseudovirgaria hyperparasitica]KAF2755606.1 hypothetical protein EJ05DRAFT_513096 [Pseudovirgaria hyperparasitica]
MFVLQVSALIGALATSVAAHGRVIEVVADGVWYQGYDPSFQYQPSPPTVIGWTAPETQDNGFVAPDAYANPDIICHKGATPGGASAKVAAGGTVSLFWSVWPESHHGPVIDYLANCEGNCSAVDKTSLNFFKISQGGVVDGSTAPGTWASDELIANNNTWEVTIPTDIAPGNYVLRHEIIALHSAGQDNGAQNYPQCINLQVTGTGANNPAGVAGTALYKSTDPGILFNLYSAPIEYTIPGPALISGEISGAQPSGGTLSVAPTLSPTPVDPSQLPSSAFTSSPVVVPSSGPSSIKSEVVPTSAFEPITQASPSSIITVTSYIDVSDCAAPTAAPASSSDELLAPSPVAITAAVAADTTPTSSVVLPTALVSQIDEILTVIPSGFLNSPFPAIPSPTPGSDANTPPLPEGTTLKDLLDWLSYILHKYFKHGGERNHARDLFR